ncbi:MAG: diguanylate cyclase [Bacteroidales bacterium]
MVRADFATRLRQTQPALRGRLRGREVLDAIVRAVNATLEPEKVAEAILEHFAQWVPAPAHVFVVSDLSGAPSMLTGRGVPAGSQPALQQVAAWVLRHGETFAAANLEHDRRVQGTAASVLAVPLAGRRPVGVLIALDTAPSGREPRLTVAVERAMQAVLEPAAVAFENALRLAQAEALSVTDDLTRLYNSRFLNLALRRETKRAVRNGRPLSLLFIDLDGFKSINDCHGHLAGSRALVETASLLRDSGRETDIVARFGGDEFAIVLPETNSAGALLVARRVRDRVAEHRFLASEGLSVRLTASIGAATLPDVASTPDELMAAADKAMYRVKDRGKDGIEIAEVASFSSDKE